MKKGWELNDYVNYVKIQLGGSVVDISTENDLSFVVEKLAFEELKNYIQTVETMTCGFSKCIDLKDKHVAKVRYVIRGQLNSSTITGMDTNLFIYQTQGQYGINQFAKDQIVYQLEINQLRNTLSTDMDFNFDNKNEMLYVYAQAPIPSSITIGYTPEYTNVNQIYEPYWMNYLKRLSVAYAKEVEGRVRSKYTLNSATYSLDGNTLLAESQNELSIIRDELNSNINLSHTIS